MAQIKPFMAVRPVEKFAGRVAALPYDVYNRQEAKAEVEREPLSFLKIDRAETQFPDEVDIYDDRVYQKAADMLAESRRDGIYMTDQDDAYYIYRLTKKRSRIVSAMWIPSVHRPDRSFWHTVPERRSTVWWRPSW